MQRLASVLIAILALAVFAAAGYVVLKKDPVPHAGQVLPVSSAALGSGQSTSPRPSGSASPSVQGKVVAFLGDDWTLGTGASAKSKRFTTIVSKQLGLVQRNFGDDGTGYAKSSGDAGAYSDRVTDVVAAKPDAVVVSGGRNDNSDSLSTVEAGVKSLFTKLHKKLPDATLIAIEPMWGDSDKPGELVDIGKAVKKDVMAVGGTYLPIADPIHNHSSYMSDDSDPDDDGYAAIAKAVETPLRNALAA